MKQYQKCIVGKKTGYRFIKWIEEYFVPIKGLPVDTGDTICKRIYALVLKPNGHVKKVNPKKVTFEY